MPERKFVYMDEHGMRRTLVWDEAEPDRFGVFAEASFEKLGELNRWQGERESARAATTTIARVPFPIWERAYHEGWDEKKWNEFLNDPAHRDFRVWPGRV
jgi:hypothetical protein